MIWIPGEAKGGTEGFKIIGTRPLFPLRRLNRKSEPCEGEPRFLVSWYNLPRVRNFKSRRREIIPLAPCNYFLWRKLVST